VLWLVPLAAPVVGGFATRLLPTLLRATIAVVTLALLIAVVNAGIDGHDRPPCVLPVDQRWPLRVALHHPGWGARGGRHGTRSPR
jgi:hypothetical protein